MFALVCAALLAGGVAAWDPVWYQPEQVHLAYADDASAMSVMWVTTDHCEHASVQYGSADAYKLDRYAAATASKFINIDKKDNRTMWIYKADMVNLQPGQRYVYHVGSVFGWSDVFTFEAKRMDAGWAPRLLVYGDMGNANARSVPYLQKEAQMRQADTVLHIGDFAYDMDTDRGLVGDAFMRQVEPIAAYIPYMTLPGNHEKSHNFSQYRNRFNMPGEFDSMMYSMTLGRARIIMFNSEVFYKNESPDRSVMYTQYRWLKKQLEAANTPSARAATPWLIVMAHRPMYCSNDDGPYEHCNNPTNPVREGLSNITRAYSLEDLFYQHGVDMHFYAHEHSYERLYPLYRGRMCNGSRSQPYTNPTGPVHIITGSAGDREKQTRFDPLPYDYSAFRSDDYGYTRLHVHNTTHISLQQVSTDKGGAIIDTMTLIKDKHGAGLHTCHL